MYTLEKEALKELLDSLYDQYARESFIEQDPISIPHMFSTRGDREVSGFLSSTIAWGNRKAIVKNARRMMEAMDWHPYEFTVHSSDVELRCLESYVHRTFNGRDLISFVLAMRNIIVKYGGIGDYFESLWEKSGDIRIVLSAFRSEFFCIDHECRCEKHLSSIDKGAACKRLNMYLRWMVRDDGRGVDFGLWKKIPSSALYLPLDVHSGNMGRALGLLSRKQNDWKAVEEITMSLREFDPEDPVKYDFALFGAGISGFLK